MKNTPFRVGLTGGIGSGKTTVSNCFKQLGVEIIDADIIAKTLTTPNTPAYESILDHFGRTILNNDATLNRKKLRDIIFSNTKEKKWLENLLHPMIRQQMRELIADTETPYCICVIPLLAEATGINYIDRILVIETPVEIQLSRANIRDKMSNAAIQKIIDTQANHNKRRLLADDVLINDCDLNALKTEVERLHQRYLELAYNQKS